MLGLDLIEIDRLERALERRPRLAARLFRPGELAYARSRRRPAAHLAARFAAKEAAVKAIGLGGFGLRDVEVIGGGAEPPSLRLHGRPQAAAREAGIELSVTLTHSRQLAAAAVLATPRAP